MMHVCWIVSACIFAFSVPVTLTAAERTVKQYRIDEHSASQVELSPYVLTVSSENLEKYPRSVVTFAVTTDRGRSPSSIDPNVAAPERLAARRHYTRMSADEFGHAGTSQVVFDRQAGTVFIGFVGGKNGKKFFFKELESSTAEIARHQTQPPGTPDSR